MADELLSVESSGLVAIANAIRTKGGTNAPLTFPNGFVSALQAIETEATVTPKITPQQKVLTPTDTSFSIDAGFHDGTGTVSIQTETGSANPTSSQQVIYPPSGKFFSSFVVGGLGAGTQVVTGTTTLNASTMLTVSGLSFTPVGMVVLLSPDPNAKLYIDQYAAGIKAQNFTPYSSAIGWSNVSSNSVSNYTIVFSFSAGNAQAEHYGSQRFTGTYHYIVWGN